MIFLLAFMLAVVSALGICADIVKAFFCEPRLGSGGLIVSYQNMGLGRMFWQGMAC